MERPLAGDKVSVCSSPIVVPQGVVSGCFCPQERSSDVRKMAVNSRIIRIFGHKSTTLFVQMSEK